MQPFAKREIWTILLFTNCDFDASKKQMIRHVISDYDANILKYIYVTLSLNCKFNKKWIGEILLHSRSDSVNQ